MNCKYCSNPATIHLTDLVGGEKKVTHLCKQCAEAKKMLKQADVDLPGLLQGLISKHIGKEAEELSSLVCPDCGIRYMDFRAQGRLGCPNDYVHFRKGLEPLIDKIHRMKKHVGKCPENSVPISETHLNDIIRLRQELKSAIESEAYEQAAKIRDLLKLKGNSYGL